MSEATKLKMKALYVNACVAVLTGGIAVVGTWNVREAQARDERHAADRFDDSFSKTGVLADLVEKVEALTKQVNELSKEVVKLQTQLDERTKPGK